jgi:ABC-2 type transport system ATP-binding protein
MKATIVDRAKRGAAIVVSSHLLHLVEEIANRVLILKDGQSVALGSLEEIRRLAPGLSRQANLEDIFLTVTGGASTST